MKAEVKEAVHKLNIMVGLQNMSLKDVWEAVELGLAGGDDPEDTLGGWWKCDYDLVNQGYNRWCVVCTYTHGGYGQGCFAVKEEYPETSSDTCKGYWHRISRDEIIKERPECEGLKINRKSDVPLWKGLKYEFIIRSQKREGK